MKAPTLLNRTDWPGVCSKLVTAYNKLAATRRRLHVTMADRTQEILIYKSAEVKVRNRLKFLYSSLDKLKLRDKALVPQCSGAMFRLNEQKHKRNRTMKENRKQAVIKKLNL